MILSLGVEGKRGAKPKAKAEAEAKPIRLRIEGRPTPWKAPIQGRTRQGGPISFRDPNYEAWHQSIALQARVQCAGLAPLAVPCRLEATFRLRKKSGAYPDLVNLTKALEDGLQGFAVENDRLIAEHITKRLFVDQSGWEGVEALLIPLAPSADPNSGPERRAGA